MCELVARDGRGGGGERGGGDGRGALVSAVQSDRGGEAAGDAPFSVVAKTIGSCQKTVLYCLVYSGLCLSSLDMRVN